MTGSDTVSRRQLLAVGVSGALAGLAGCSAEFLSGEDGGGGDGSTSDETPDGTPEPVTAGDPPVVDNGGDNEAHNVEVLVRVFDSGGEPVSGATVVLRDEGGSLDVRRGETGSSGWIRFVESVGPPPCNPLVLELPAAGRERRLGCRNGGRSFTVALGQ